MSNQIKDAVYSLKRGDVVIFPTDTAYGIGCRMDSASSVKRVFAIRRRSEEKAVLILVDSIKMAEKYLLPLGQRVKELMDKYWPGGLTIVLPCKREKVPSIVRAGGDTIGVRLPDHQVIRQIITAVGVPIIAPSANIASEKTPFRIEGVDRLLINKAEHVLYGKCTLKKQSTVIDCSVEPWRILREGAVNLEL